MFSTLSRREIIILATFDLSSANALNLVSSKTLSFGKELKRKYLQMTKPLENTVGKGENACNKHFLRFPTMFSTVSDKNFKNEPYLSCPLQKFSIGLF